MKGKGRKREGKARKGEDGKQHAINLANANPQEKVSTEEDGEGRVEAGIRP